jgi:hypothetical protein
MQILLLIIIFLILIILCCCIIKYSYKKNISGGSPHIEILDHDKEYIKKYFMSEYNDDIIKKKISNILSINKSHNRKNFGDIVIDSLNLIHFIRNSSGYISTDNIYSSIKYIAKKLKRFFSGRIMFAIKNDENNTESSKNNEHYKKLAKELHVFIYIAELYSENAPTWKLPSHISQDIHSAKGRDDYSAIMLANKFNCPILSNDNYSDRREYHATIAPFKLLEYNWFSAKLPIVEQYRPDIGKIVKFTKTKIKLNTIFMENELSIVDII